MGIVAALGVVLAARGATAATPHPPVHRDGPPPAHTGGFGEPTCRACHTEYELNVGGEVRVTGLPPAWEPGRTYRIEVELRSSEMVRAGFEAAVRFADGPGAGTQAGEVAALDGRTRVQVDGGTGVRYVSHTGEGAEATDPDRVGWAFTWTAPAEGGAVVFHAAANSANGDDSPLGDLIYAAAFPVQAPAR